MVLVFIRSFNDNDVHIVWLLFCLIRVVQVLKSLGRDHMIGYILMFFTLVVRLCVMLIVGYTSKDGRPAKSARRSDREEEDMTHAYL
jgi:hypothetical protein